MKTWGIGALGLAWVIVACSSFDSTSADSAGNGGDAGPDGPGNLTGIAHAFNIELATDAAVVTGKDVTIPITITRGGGATGPSTISVQGLADGVAALDVTVQESETTASLVITAEAAAKQGMRALKVVGRNAAANDQVELALSLLVRGPSGTLDLTWGTLGVAALPDNFNVLAMANGTDDSVTMAGLQGASGASQVPALGKLLATGTTDPLFNGGSTVLVPTPGGAAPVLRVDATGAGAVMFVAYNSGGTYLFRFQRNGSADPSVHSGATTGLQQIDANNSAESAAQDAQGSWYTRAGNVIHRYAANGDADVGFGAQTLGGAGSPDFVRAGGSGIAVVWSTLGAGVWRSTSSGVVRTGLTASTASVDATGRVYLSASGTVMRYKTDFADVDTGFSPPTLSTAFATVVPPTLTGLDDELYVHGGTNANTGGSVASTTILTKYLSTGSIDKSFGKDGTVEPLSGTFSPAPLVRTKDGRIYVARAATDGASRSVARYWP